MENRQNLPNFDRISIITGSILLLLMLIPFIPERRFTTEVSLPFFKLPITASWQGLIPILAAVLAAFGIEWLIEDHPMRSKVRFPLYWITPALTSLAISLPLNSLKPSAVWWLLFVLGAVTMILVLVSEYITLDPDDQRYEFASLALIAVMHALLIGITISLRLTTARLYLLVLVLAPAIYFVTLRALFLRSDRNYWPDWSLGITVAVSGLIIGLHYLPVNPAVFGIIVVGVTYALGALASGMIAGEKRWNLWLEPGIVTLVILIGALAV